nr:uncharacterized protein LOC108075456 [Drosophila kikkawai]
MNSCSSRLVIFVCFILLRLRQEIPVAEADDTNINSVHINTDINKEPGKETIHKENKPNSNNEDGNEMIHKEGSQNSNNEAGQETIDLENDTDSIRSINHNRPRPYHMLPGRKLKTRRRCRPYEVLDEGGTCVHKIGKQGLYEHRNHVYGLQRRHRHPSSDGK